ncbi:MAG: hypothetical protein QHJ73_08175, partial [Armatimonadota bacterium]|nr:hypothetical protein [Armatimonadota bacterium]
SLSAVAEGALQGAFAGATRFNLAPSEERVVEWTGKAARSANDEMAVLVRAQIAGFDSAQRVRFLLTNRVSLGLIPQARGQLAALVGSAFGEALDGTLVAQIGAETLRFSLQLPGEGGTPRVTREQGGAAAPVAVATKGEGMVEIPLLVAPAPGARTRLVLRKGGAVVADTGVIRWVPVTADAHTLHGVNDGDAKVPATFALTDAQFTEKDAPVPVGLRFTYEYGEGWKFVRLAPVRPMPVEGKPEAMGVWVKGDGLGCALRLRFVDQNGRTFQPNFGSLEFKEWRYLTAPLNDPRVGHWGGTGDETRIAYPIRIDSLALVDGPRAVVKGEVLLGGFQLHYRE